MLWAGADPYAKGLNTLYKDPFMEEDRNALELAAKNEHFDVFNLKQIRLDPANPALKGLLLNACYTEKSDFLEKLLEETIKQLEEGAKSLKNIYKPRTTRK